MKSSIKLVNTLWLFMMALTLFSAYLAESAHPGLSSTAIMALVIAIKGRIIVDHFMELKHAHIVLRSLMRAYYYVIPAFVMLVYFFPQQLARWTSL